MRTKTSPIELERWLEVPEEGSRFEFKEKKTKADYDELGRYTTALANEGGGKVVLGVTDKRPRKIVGTAAFTSLDDVERNLNHDIPLIRIEVEEVNHPDGRVVVFHVPPHPIGRPVPYREGYWMRSGDSLVGMKPDYLQRIFAEGTPDFSATIVSAADLSALSSAAIEEFRRRWIKRSGNEALSTLSHGQLLADAGLFVDGTVTVAALVLVGSAEGLKRHLAQAEVVCEYRTSDGMVGYSNREEFREGFFSIYDRVWQWIDARNERQAWQEGLFRYDVPAFAEQSVREALLNAVAHRDYSRAGSIFVRIWPRRLEITSPGGLPAGITVENILDRQEPRNRRIAEAFQRCGLVERSGQGMNRIFEEAIRQSKPAPDLSRSDEHQVSLTLRGQVSNPGFIRFLERIEEKEPHRFTTADLLVLDAIQKGSELPKSYSDRVDALLDAGVVERIGRGRGAKVVLARSLYDAIGQPGVYTRKRGLDHETNKELLVKHLREAGKAGSPMAQLHQVLPQLTRPRVLGLLKELQVEGRASLTGARRGARWLALIKE